MRDWLYENEHLVLLNGKQMTLLIDRIAQDAVGIAMPGIFVINYSLVGAVSRNL